MKKITIITLIFSLCIILNQAYQLTIQAVVVCPGEPGVGIYNSVRKQCEVAEGQKCLEPYIKDSVSEICSNDKDLVCEQINQNLESGCQDVISRSNQSIASPSFSGGGTITIGNSATSSSTLLSSSSLESISSSSSAQNSSTSDSKNSGVLAFEALRSLSSASSINILNIDPTKTKIMVSAEIKNTIDSAKGGTFRTGGL